MGLSGVALQDWLVESGHDLIAVAAAAADLLADECRVAASDNAERLVDLASVEQRLQVASVRALSAFDVAGDYHDLGAASPQRYLTHWCRITGPDASARRRAAKLWRRFDAVAVALTHAEITTAHLAVLARAAERGREALFGVCQNDLVDIARHANSFAVFERAIDAWIAAADDLLDRGEPSQRYERRHLQLTTTIANMLLVRGRLSEEQRDIVIEAFEHATRRNRNPDRSADAGDRDGVGCDDGDDGDGEGVGGGDGDGGSADTSRTTGQLMADAFVEMCHRYLSDLNNTTRGPHGPVSTVDVVISPAMVAEWLDEHRHDLPTEIIDLLDPGHQSDHGDGDHGDGECRPATDDASGGEPAEDQPVHPDRDDNRGRSLTVPGTKSPAAVTPLGFTGDELRAIANHPTDRLGSLAAEILRSGPIHSSTAALLTCDSWIGVTIFTAGGEVLHHGRRHRLFTPAQRHALALRDGGCVVPGCDRPITWCDAHHLTPWVQGGATDIDNAAMVCRHHHVSIHHGSILTRHPDGTWTLQPPKRTGRRIEPLDLDRFRHMLKRTRNHHSTNQRIRDHLEHLVEAARTARTDARPPPEPPQTTGPAPPDSPGHWPDN